MPKPPPGSPSASAPRPRGERNWAGTGAPCGEAARPSCFSCHSIYYWDRRVKRYITFCRSTAFARRNAIMSSPSLLILLNASHIGSLCIRPSGRPSLSSDAHRSPPHRHFPSGVPLKVSPFTVDSFPRHHQASRFLREPPELAGARCTSPAARGRERIRR